MKPEFIIDLCKSCAENIYGVTRPNARYANSIAALLAGTAATESEFQYRRQHGFDYEQGGGAWGLWQTEWAAVSDSIKYLKSRPALFERARMWVYLRGTVDLAELIDAPVDRVLRVLRHNDALACLFARLHYLRFSAAIPDTVEGQATYWKKYYNTHLGAGTPQKYIAKFHHYVLPHWTTQ